MTQQETHFVLGPEHTQGPICEPRQGWETEVSWNKVPSLCCFSLLWFSVLFHCRHAACGILWVSVLNFKLCLLYWILKSMLYILVFSDGSDGKKKKKSACNAGDQGSVPGLGRSPREWNGYPVQYSCMENSMDRGIWQATFHVVIKSQIPLSDWH